MESADGDIESGSRENPERTNNVVSMALDCTTASTPNAGGYGAPGGRRDRTRSKRSDPLLRLLLPWTPYLPTGTRCIRSVRVLILQFLLFTSWRRSKSQLGSYLGSTFFDLPSSTLHRIMFNENSRLVGPPSGGY